MRSLLLVVAALLLGSCGTRGPLVLPPKPQTATPPAQGAVTPADNSSKASAGAAQ